MGGRASSGNGVGVAFVGGEKRLVPSGGDGREASRDGAVDFDFPFELAVGSEGGEKCGVRGAARDLGYSFRDRLCPRRRGAGPELQSAWTYHLPLAIGAGWL